MHLDLKRCAQPFGDEVDGCFFEKLTNLHSFSRSCAKQPLMDAQPYRQSIKAALNFLLDGF
ncbi:hypothetical protein [Dickeya solani]|uniref:Uncharacterized protein n=1 Tax=Dickeya solani TaxID=1089444 RepID=A0AAX4EXW4_9GAMM|nr:hypothetical protein [Dickeya solani]WOA52063.1 hypothetical protein RXA29_19625 [Dickeya solani]